jgi:protein-serine/threonine kinase
MPARQSVAAFARGLGMTPMASTATKAPKSSTSSDEASSSSSRERSTSKGGSSGRINVRILEAVDILALHPDSQVYCLLEVNQTVSRSSPPVRTASSSSSGPGERSLDETRGLGTHCLLFLRAACNPVFDYAAEFDVNSDECDVFVSIYDRHGAPEDDEGGFVGAASLRLPLSRKGDQRDELLTCVRVPSPQHALSVPNSLTDRKGARVDGGIRLRIRHEPLKRRKLTPDDFEVFEVLGEGAFGVVYRVRKRDTDRVYAMKVRSDRHSDSIPLSRPRSSPRRG